MKATAHYFFTLLCGLLVLAGATSVQAAGGTTGSCTWDLTGSTLTISGTGAMANYSTTTTSPWYSSRASIKAIAIQNGVTTIGEAAFYDCIGVTSVSIPSSVTTIGGYAFRDCTSLTSVSIPSSVTTIGGYAFAVCSSLTSVSIPSSVTSIGNGVFQRCISLTSVTIPSSVTTIADYAFFDCGGLTSVTIPSSVTSIGNSVFCYCSSLTSITIPSSVTSIGSSAFSFCSGLTSVTIPSSVTSIGTYTFSICSSLTSVTISSSVTSIGNSAFSDCSSLTSVTIPSSVTSIGNGVFQRCSNLTSITIPSSVTSIGDKAFESCTKLTSVTCVGTTPPTAATAGGGAFPQSNLYVPASALAAYQQATWWKDFKSITGIGNGSSSFLLDVTLSSVKAGVIDATSAQSGMYASGASVTLRATGKAGYSSFAWKNASGTTVSTANPYKFSLTANTTLIATWTPVTYSITYSNTKSVAHSNPSTYTVESAKITLANLSAAGYTFNGWYDAATGGSKVTAIATGSTGNRTLYAQWTTNTYSITYSCADLKGNTAPAGKSYTVETPTFTLPALSATGYTFEWYDAATGGNKVTQVAVGSTGSKTYYGRWTTNTYTITYSCADLKGNTAPANKSYTVETPTFTLPALSATGYTFGWYDAATGGSKVTQVAVGSTGSKTLYARWTPVTYSITYSGDLKSNKPAPASYTVENLPLTLPALSATGYTFEGWYTAQTGGDKVEQIAAGSTGNKTLYARWTTNTYAITYSCADLKGNAAPAGKSYTVETPTFTLPVLSAADYTFGWYDDATGGSKVEQVAQGSTGSYTLYGRWTPVEYIITYSNLKGSATPTPASYTVETNTFSLPVISATGYSFSGWYDAETGGTRVTQVPKGSTGDVTLYGRWAPVPYDIRYHNTKSALNPNPLTYNIDSADITLRPLAKNGYYFEGWYDDPTAGAEVTYIPAGSAGEQDLYGRWTLRDYAISYYDPLGAPSNPNPATYNIDSADITLRPLAKTGYAFNGWFDAEVGGAYVSVILAGSTGNVELWAQWSPNAYTVVYHGNGATGDTTAGSAHTYNAASRLTRNGFVREGYVFDGWATTPAGARMYDDTSFVFNLTATPNGVVALYAKWKPNHYTVAYRGNGATSDTTAGTKHIYGVPSPLAASGFKRIGYTFAAWNTQPDGSGDSYAAGANVTAVAYGANGVATLYAVWTAHRYTVVYHGNGATGDTTAGAQHTYDEEKPLADNGFTKTGYTFVGWNTQRNGGGTAYAAGDLALNFTSTANDVVTLYAQWTLNTYTVTYHGNGATSDATAGTKHTYSVPSPLAASGFKRIGYTFAAWNTQPDGSGDSYAAGANATTLTTVANGVVTLYAQWSPNPYTVVYQGNAATVTGSTASSAHTYDREHRLTRSGFRRTGYSFAGWATTPTGAAVYADTASVSNLTDTKNATVTLYATWAAHSYTVSYSGNAAAVVGVMPSSTHAYDAPARLTRNGFSRAGYAFDGWATSPTGARVFSDSVLITNLTAAKDTIVTLYAVWTPARYTVVYHGNGATSGATQSSAHTYGVERTLTPNGFSRVGYNFDGWATTPAGVAEFADKGSVLNLTAVHSDAVPLYAVWTAHRYTVVYHGNGATGDTTAGTQHAYGEEKPLSANGFTKTGYTFSGWNTRKDGKGVAYADSENVLNLTDSNGATITLYAVWTAHRYTVVYHGNGATGDTTESAQHTYNVSAQLAGNGFTRTGYAFTGWNAQPDGSCNRYAAGATVSNLTATPNGVVTLYAQWSAVSYRIRYSLGGGTNHPDNPDAYTVITPTITLQPATRKGYTLSSWIDLSGNPVASIPQGSTGDRTLLAGWVPDGNQPSLHTVTFVTHTGDVSVRAQAVTGGGTAAQPAVERKGYAVEGWYTKNTYAPDTRWDFATSVVTQDVTLYARWDTVYYRIYYSLGGGANHPANPDSFCIASLVITLHPAARAGYIFDGWRDAIGNAVTGIPAGSTGDRTLLAGWTPNGGITPPPVSLHTVTFVTHTGDVSVRAQAVAGGGTAAQPAVERKGYAVEGWYTKNTYAPATRWDFATSVVTQDVTLYARWDTVYYHIYYSLGGGANHPANADSFCIASPAITLHPATRADYTFDGWRDVIGNLVASIPQGSTGDKLLAAQWTPDGNQLTPPSIATCNVIFHPNGGSGFSVKTVSENTPVAPPADPVRARYTFGGWYVDATCTSAWNFSTPVTRDTTLYARWVYTPALYPVILVRDNGAPNDTLRVAHSDTIPRPANPSRDGYTFAGWYGDVSFSALWNFPTDRLMGSVTLYAKWISDSVATCTVSFFTGDGGSVVDPQVVEVGEKVKCPNDPQKMGYIFDGWYSSATLTDSSRWDFDAPVTQDVTLYAQWEHDNDVWVYFIGSDILPQKVDVGGRVTKPADPQRANCKFLGWYRDSTFIIPWDFECDLVGTRGATLYAKWEVISLQLDSVMVSGGHGQKIAVRVDEEGQHISCELPCNDPDATLLLTFHTPNGVSSGLAGDTLRLHVEGGHHDTSVVFRSFDHRHERRYTLSVERELEFNKVVHAQLGARLLMVVNNPLHNGGFHFREALWRIGGELDRSHHHLYYVSHDKRPITDSVKVTLIDSLGRTIHVCPHALSDVPAAPAAAHLSAYPNPVPAAGTIHLKDDLLAAIADGHYSTFRLLSAAGVSIRSASAADLAEGLAMPATPDVYFLILEGAEGKATIAVTVGGQ